MVSSAGLSAASLCPPARPGRLGRHSAACSPQPRGSWSQPADQPAWRGSPARATALSGRDLAWPCSRRAQTQLRPPRALTPVCLSTDFPARTLEPVLLWGLEHSRRGAAEGPQPEDRSGGGQWREPAPAPNLRVTLEAPSEWVSALPLQPAGASGRAAPRAVGGSWGRGGGAGPRLLPGAAGHGGGQVARPQPSGDRPPGGGNLRLRTGARGWWGRRGERAGECLALCRGELAAELWSNSLPDANASTPFPPLPPPPTPDSWGQPGSEPRVQMRGGKYLSGFSALDYSWRFVMVLLLPWPP